MSRFVEGMVATAHAGGWQRGMVTGEPHEPVRRTWFEVHERARCVAGGLVANGITPGSAVAVLAAAPELVAASAQGTWLAGCSLTMLHQPTPRMQLEQWAADTVTVLSMIGSRLVLLGDQFLQLAPILEEHDIPYRRVTDLFDSEPLAEPVSSEENALALLQLTSGSTAVPKAVRITHANLYSNMSEMVQRAEFDPEQDVMMSWLPTFHDMGMVGFLTLPMMFGVELVKITPADFLTTPLVWPELITKYRATTTAAPNFAYAVVGKRLARVEDDNAYDLSTLRIALNGAEPIDPAAVGEFTDAGARFKMAPECMFAAYGLAESTLAVSFAPLHTGLTVDVVEADPLESGHQAVPVPEDDPRRGTEEVRGFAVLGRALGGLEAEVVDEHGRACDEYRVGEIRLRGNSVSPGYLTTEGSVPTQDSEGWFYTGDLGYVRDDMIVVCGRKKDVVIVGGRNIYPTDIERAAMEVEGVRAGNAVAVRIDGGTRREGFAVVLESAWAGDADAEQRLIRQVTSRVRDVVDSRPYAVVVASRGSLPKTPSGKVKRGETATRFREDIEAGFSA